MCSKKTNQTEEQNQQKVSDFALIWTHYTKASLDSWLETAIDCIIMIWTHKFSLNSKVWIWNERTNLLLYCVKIRLEGGKKNKNKLTWKLPVLYGEISLAVFVLSYFSTPCKNQLRQSKRKRPPDDQYNRNVPWWWRTLIRVRVFNFLLDVLQMLTSQPILIDLASGYSEPSRGRKRF